ncbi:hypothetical protein RQP46_000522 [Phenoliferia psychrophenolica]
MAATASKPLPGGLHSFVHGTAHETHRDLGQGESSSSHSDSNSFRSQWPRGGGGSDDDFGRSVPPHLAQHIAPHRQPLDGGDVLALLSPFASSSLTDSVHGDWADELSATQSQPWKHEQEARVPHDPDLKGKGKGRAPGDTSPTAEELLSSVSSLDLKSMQYLKTLLAGSPEESVRSYLERGQYTDDIYGLPDEVRTLLQKAQGGESAQEEGRGKAVRRLQMVMRHLWGQDAQVPGAQSPSVTIPSSTVPREVGSADWATELNNATAARSATVSSSPSSAAREAIHYARPQQYQVRSLTATEIARVQQFPDDAFRALLLPQPDAYQPQSTNFYASSGPHVGVSTSGLWQQTQMLSLPPHLASATAANVANVAMSNNEDYASALASTRGVDDDYFSRAAGVSRMGPVMGHSPDPRRDGARDEQQQSTSDSGALPAPFQDFIKNKLATMGGSPGL